MSNCRICKHNEAVYSWQPFGPDDTIDCFPFCGSHYRGFTAVNVCDECKRAIIDGSTELHFTVKSTKLVVHNHKVERA